MWRAIKGILGSKKALMTIAAIAVWAAGKIGWDLDTEALAGAVLPLWLYVWAQGRADQGKAAAEINAKVPDEGADQEAKAA